MEKFKNDKLELKGLITTSAGGWTVRTNLGCDDPDIMDTETCEIWYLDE